MTTRNPAVDAYIREAAPFARPILKHLRKVVHTGCPAIVETIKWGHPHFEYKGNLAGMAAFKAHCSFGFWKGALIFDQELAGRDDAMGHFGRLGELSDLPNEKTLLRHVRKAVELNEAGIKVPRAAKTKEPRRLEIPAELTSALGKDARARQTFDSFSHSDRKEYVEWISEAKRPETRRQRLETTLEWLREGKSRNWKYQRQR
ncbi:MAG: YdeI/OmpD-associated family protein [Chthoniobacterales bacterium]